jgi:hypothetical protein
VIKLPLLGILSSKLGRNLIQNFEFRIAHRPWRKAIHDLCKAQKVGQPDFRQQKSRGAGAPTAGTAKRLYAFPRAGVSQQCAVARALTVLIRAMKCLLLSEDGI